MIVYIEYVLIDNFIIDYLLLKTSLALVGITVKGARLFVCALLGAIFALLIPIISVSPIILVLVKVLFGLLMVMLSTKFRDFREFFICSLLFFTLTFLTGGVVIGVCSILGINPSSEFLVSVMFVPSYFIIKGVSSVIKYLYRKKEVVSLTVEVELVLDNVRLKGKGFFDTGNALYDGDRPVIICSKNFAKGLVSSISKDLKFKRLNVLTVNGQRQNLAIELSTVLIYNLPQPNIFNNVTLCIVKESVGEGYDLILHPALCKGGSNEQTKIKIEKVS